MEKQCMHHFSRLKIINKTWLNCEYFHIGYMLYEFASWFLQSIDMHGNQCNAGIFAYISVSRNMIKKAEMSPCVVRLQVCWPFLKCLFLPVLSFFFFVAPWKCCWCFNLASCPKQKAASRTLCWTVPKRKAKKPHSWLKYFNSNNSQMHWADLKLKCVIIWIFPLQELRGKTE